MQEEHTETAVAELYVPAAHFAQAEVAIIAAPVPYVPATQREHIETPTSELYVPTAQFVHVEAAIPEPVP